MTDGTRSLIVLSAALASADEPQLEAAMSHAAAEADPAAAEEVLLQSYLFLGYPRTLDALARWRRITGRPAPEPAEPPNWVVWRARGERTCERVYGGQYERLRANVQRLHPELEDWMLTEGYGKVLGRSGAPLVLRELCIAALLVGSGALPQLRSHLRGALNAGAAEEDVTEAVELACAAAPDERVAPARAVWDEVRSRWQATHERSRDVR